MPMPRDMWSTCSSGETADTVLKGFTITDGKLIPYGSGIYCIDYSSPTITNCTISDNSASNGGGIYCFYNSSPTITNCTISDNYTPTSAGGIYCSYGSLPKINNTIIYFNAGG